MTPAAPWRRFFFLPPQAPWTKTYIRRPGSAWVGRLGRCFAKEKAKGKKEKAVVRSFSEAFELAEAAPDCDVHICTQF